MYLKESLICKKQNVGKTVGIAYTDAFTLGLLDYGNHDYFGQYWNHDYSNDYFLVWKHVVISACLSRIFCNWELWNFALKKSQNGQKENAPI